MTRNMTIANIESNIANESARANLIIAGNPQLLEEYERRKKELQTLKRDIESLGEAHSTLSDKIKQLRV